jgi:hypothetical protein
MQLRLDEQDAAPGRTQPRGSLQNKAAQSWRLGGRAGLLSPECSAAAHAHQGLRSEADRRPEPPTSYILFPSL